ncbi:MAG: dienelactone hydrolase family protein [Chloracidobacterium sp.]|uniref:Dienelactone hydrolase family protein n=1 Tax=Chloracidobacterium validum TaxID=2821543 RepID=A0ABX8BAG9_9BACT|nr:dienelactone hydrolase family protein [Chloracidobacterium validum]QUW03873.1 dienelactone hydrolase family protein [Chloracidobacterium validum]
MAGQRTELTANNLTVAGYLSVPATGGPGVIVLQEWWGLVPHIEAVADRFAEAGYVAFAPDLYDGQATTSPDEAGKLMMALNIGETATKLRAVVHALLAHPATAGHPKVGVIGFCMGGQLALYAACENPEIGACVDFYGIHPNVKPNFANLSAPVLGLFAEKDAFVTPEAVAGLRSELDQHGKTYEFDTYPGTDHAFFNDTRPEVYHADAAYDAWDRVLRFFRANLS